MTQQLLRNIVLMCLWLALGIINWVAALLVSGWVTIFCLIVAFLDFFMAWVNHRRAKRIAKILDTPKTIVITMVEGEVKAEPQAEHDENEISGHPV